MHMLSDWRLFPPQHRGGVLCVGNFDGVHRGHAKMLSTGRAEATARGKPFTIMTFDPHPHLLLKPEVPRFPLTTLEQRIALLEAFKPDVLLVVPTTREFLAMGAEGFLRDVVASTDTGIGATLLVEGRTFTYGQGAKGTVETLQGEKGGRAFGIETLIVPTQEATLTDFTVINVSSSVIRWLIEQGRVADAGRALGRPYTLRGEVVEGARRGRTIGFPTANLRTPQLAPAAGVYAGSATVDGRTCGAAISVGTNPTFEGGRTTIEAHLLDFSGNLYGRTIEVALCRWVREMLVFAGVRPLTDQMRRDVEWTRRVLAAEKKLSQ
jgi:riboflavin kinase / FMN adenylyltransferase